MRTLGMILETVFSDAEKTGHKADSMIAGDQLVPVFDGLINDENENMDKFKEYVTDSIVPLLDSINKVTCVETPPVGKVPPASGIVLVHMADRGYIPNVIIYSKPDNRMLTLYPNPGKNVVIASDSYNRAKIKGTIYDFKKQAGIVTDIVNYLFPLRLKHMK